MSSTRRALLDTSVVIAGFTNEATAPNFSSYDELFISSLSYSELHFGLVTALLESPENYFVRKRRFDSIEDVFGIGIPYDDAAADAYGEILRQIAAGTKDKKGLRAHTLDKMIAAIALSRDMDLLTRNAADLKDLDELVSIVEI